jgi:hypothetical protein
MSDDVARLHIELPDDLHAAVKRVASERGQTLKGLVIVQLRRVVAEHERGQRDSQGTAGGRGDQ